jgi:hypothetical protein
MRLVEQLDQITPSLHARLAAFASAIADVRPEPAAWYDMQTTSDHQAAVALAEGVAQFIKMALSPGWDAWPVEWLPSFLLRDYTRMCPGIIWEAERLAERRSALVPFTKSQEARPKRTCKTHSELESAAEEYLKANPASRLEPLAKAIGCSRRLAGTLDAWVSRPRQKAKDRSPRVVSLSDIPEACLDEQTKERRLELLIREYEDNFEPSPLEADGDRPRQVKQPKRL